MGSWMQCGSLAAGLYSTAGMPVCASKSRRPCRVTTAPESEFTIKIEASGALWISAIGLFDHCF